MIKLQQRCYGKEYIDDPQIDTKKILQTYQEIKSINDFTFGYWPTMSAVKYFLDRYSSNRIIKILDIGCGDGETLRRIGKYAQKHKLSLKLTGIDLNHKAIATANNIKLFDIKFIHGDIFAINGLHYYDVIISSLTAHHFTDKEIVKLMKWMTDHTRIGWLISDLNRRAIAYYFIKYFVRLCRFNHFVCYDAPLSVARSFRRSEWIDFLNQAKLNLNSAKISWYPNFRYGIRYEKSL